MLRAAICARYSSALQQLSSIEDQIALCRQHASRLGCTILDEHIYADREISGTEVGRAGYQRLLEAARNRAFDAIAAEAQDRPWRNQAEINARPQPLQFL